MYIISNIVTFENRTVCSKIKVTFTIRSKVKGVFYNTASNSKRNLLSMQAGDNAISYRS